MEGTASKALAAAAAAAAAAHKTGQQ